MPLRTPSDTKVGTEKYKFFTFLGPFLASKEILTSLQMTNLNVTICKY